MKKAEIHSEIKHDNTVALLGVCEKPVSLMMKLCKSDLEPFNADIRVSSLDQFWAYMNEEDIFDILPGTANVI